jgi:hypothetical protein
MRIAGIKGGQQNGHGGKLGSTAELIGRKPHFTLPMARR